MKALFFDGELKLVTDYPKPIPVKGEALIKILMSGICNTDIEITKGYMNFTGIPGHEFVGVVEEINDSDKRLFGKRVVGDINCACHNPECIYCKQKIGRHCPNRTTLGIHQRNGCFAEFIILPIENLIEVPDSVSNEMAVLTEPLAAGFEILEQIDITPDKEVLIVGDGKLGILINHAISTTKAKITHVGKHSEKLKIAGLNNCLPILIDQLSEKKYDIVIEATGSITGFQFSIQHTKPRGILILKSTLAANQTIDLAPVVVNEITIIGSRCGLFQPALDYLKTGVDLSPIISAVFPFDEALRAFGAAKDKENLKILINNQS